MIRPENRNILWATILVDELARCGVRHAVISPGSRSTPLAVAFSRDERFRIHTIIDERAAAFFALGVGKASRMPAVAVCTSGTAAANYFPAIVEASMSNVPLIVMTADRPHELRDSGANQTIDQVKLYGGYARWFVDVAPPHANPEDKTLRYLRTTVDRAVAYAKGPNGGPVHLNVPFEKPLEPVYVEGDVPDAMWQSLQSSMSDRPLIGIEPSYPSQAYNMLQRLLEIVTASPRGLIICGPDSPVGIDLLADISRATGYPVLGEGLSSQGRIYWGADRNGGVILGGYETFLRGETAQALKPQIIIQTGSAPVGAALLEYLQRQAQARRIHISLSGKWADDSIHIDEFVNADPLAMLSNIEYYLTELEDWKSRISPDPYWLETFRELEDITWQVVDEVHEAHTMEGHVLADVVTLLPDESALFIANSNPIRHFDQFVRPQPKVVDVFCNRGVSGIDGTVASALGMAAVRAFSVAILGDTALYHDLNSLHLIRRLGIPLVIVCINNDGGGIFHRLPIANYDPPFRDLMVMPHGLTFEHAAKMFDIPYTLADMGEEFRGAFKAAIESGEPHLIEVPSDAAKFEAQRKQLIDTVAQRIAESGILEKLKTKEN